MSFVETLICLTLITIMAYLLYCITDNKGISNDIPLSKEDIEFLSELQNEMLTQDTVCQAAPRFWVVATDKYKELGTEDCFDEVNLYYYDDDEIVCKGDMYSIVEYVTERYPDELENITFTSEGLFYHVEFGEDEDRNEEFIYDSDDLLKFLKRQNILNDYYELLYYRNIHHVYPDTMFLTNRSCKEHIQLNKHHYADDAHSYAMTAWRSPEVEKSWNIIEKTNWQSLKK